ncbi:hypothetical protein [Microbacterium sp. SSM24]|uniref:hypothetical protein n=1 Tax=Microbacterium sp. SSM24 TaxID=2991714 RepID=UPI0022261D18|nr:hypothetical protein [Microbacterium sp. SSM24]MCW3494527.1 hypothetical protein [Microbacterium sp. SSM24]
MTHRNRLVLVVSLFGTLAVAVYAGIAALQILVLNPLAARPGTTLSQIHADMAEMNEAPGTGMTLTILGLGVALAIILLTLLVRRSDATPTAALLAYLSMIAMGAPAYFIASFGPGMALADTYGIGGADYARWSLLLYGASFAALVGILVTAVLRMTVRVQAAPA